ncbi:MULTISPECIES: 3-hydroxyacyl-CoA dehydrogenase NAD-binding domain-containing protein [unclassified Nocardioides]|uniref:3-hydroxyacyl-CoA dehydrogenase NAD-binding domain-containing protein n=1 Tax=unclassified Nocardioides TaxID=2615069 RepID=UPI0009F11619|nr:MULTISPECIES: 3-hydroxyacyl-CoA dehydrogenase NAD-binding domain-containing protein [unclassified Nocardioides]GAW48294.1 3-hydroxyacyl-CoA dehydrogenase [Nocardioides sp. PD653-B2]GAW52942.1 3-hydroxyacyl-CoA dehydrogenase [Nocardioides sp. PD653]
MSDLTPLLARAQEISSDAERVTEAKLRKVTLPGGAGVLGLITLDNGEDHTKPNTFGPRGLISLNTAIDAALADDEIAAIGVTGKPFILAAGADLTSISGGGADAVRVVAELGHAVFRKLGEAGGKTSFGFINGLALGGGLEVALHCDYRTVMDSAPALGLPEVMLGLVPGWGGAYLVPHLVGADKAVTVILENPLNNGKTLGGQAAYELGLADAVFGGADFLEQSLLWASAVLRGEIVVERPEVDKGEAWDAAVARGTALAEAKTGGASPAAKKAVELIAAAKSATRDEGFAAEDDALDAMSKSPELIASLYAFDLVQKRAKRPAGAPDRALARPVTKVGIVGAGLMASQLALLFVRRLEVPVVLTDLDQERVDKGVGYVHAEIDKLLAKGRINHDKANRHKALVTGAVDKGEHFADADFVIEAVFEEMSVKKSVFADLEKVVKADCILATNTSSLSITEMAADLEHPERVVGFHFFNPVAVMPLLEIVKGERTDDATLATAFATGKALKKTTILVNDSPSFIVNRLLGRFMGEVGRIVDEGTPVPVADSAFAGVAPMPPFMLLSLVGPAIALHNNETLHRAFPDRFYVSPALERVVAAKKASYYGADGAIDPEVEALLEKPDHPVVLEPAEVRTRVLTGLADEARRMLDEGVVVAAEDLDLAMITGAGFSFWNGGLTMLLEREGLGKFH